MFTTNTTIDRIVTAFCLLCAWGLSFLAVYAAFFAAPPMAWYWTATGLVAAIGMPLISTIATFPCGMLRYVLTGDDFPKGFK